VRGIAGILGIPLTVLDLREAFNREVLEYFSTSYASGRTPNPCVVCNWKIKCGKLLEYAVAIQADFLATGHYARIIAGDGGGYRLCRGKDSLKDQSYFLCWLRQEQLSHLLLPLGELTKEEVRSIAAKYSLAGQHGPESQDICFLQGESVSEYLAAHDPQTMRSGKVTTLEGIEIGQHEGLSRFTIGQRRGLGIPDATPYYVIALDADNNRVVVGKKEHLFRQILDVCKVNWAGGDEPELPQTFHVQIRYRHQGAPADVFPLERGRVHVKFHVPQRAITPGQFAVFYRGEEVVGGGEIAALPLCAAVSS
jgi:tRNA-specific 2-thiouridylase